MKRFLCIGLLLTLLGCDSAPEKFGGTFLEVLGKATEMVKGEYPDAVLWEGDAKVKDSCMTADDFLGWQFLFGIGEGYQKTAIVLYLDSTFSNVTVVNAPVFEDVIIPEVKMELTEAIELMRKANYSDVIAAANLRWPLYPGNDEPYYIFGCPKIGHVFVGVNTKNVTVVPFGPDALKGK